MGYNSVANIVGLSSFV